MIQIKLHENQILDVWNILKSNIPVFSNSWISSHYFTSKKSFQNAVEVLWSAIQDLLQPKVSTDDRHLAFKFIQCLIRGQVKYQTSMPTPPLHVMPLLLMFCCFIFMTVFSVWAAWYYAIALLPSHPGPHSVWRPSTEVWILGQVCHGCGLDKMWWCNLWKITCLDTIQS